jgi:hypothetical protein
LLFVDLFLLYRIIKQTDACVLPVVVQNLTEKTIEVKLAIRCFNGVVSTSGVDSYSKLAASARGLLSSSTGRNAKRETQKKVNKY